MGPLNLCFRPPVPELHQLLSKKSYDISTQSSGLIPKIIVWNIWEIVNFGKRIFLVIAEFGLTHPLCWNNFCLTSGEEAHALRTHTILANGVFTIDAWNSLAAGTNISTNFLCKNAKSQQLCHNVITHDQKVVVLRDVRSHPFDRNSHGSMETSTNPQRHSQGVDEINYVTSGDLVIKPPNHSDCAKCTSTSSSASPSNGSTFSYLTRPRQ